jgi:hypothetical protein
MPTEQDILAAGPPSPDDPRVQAALMRMSRGMQHVVMHLEERARRAAAGQAPPPEQPPPEDKKGPGGPTRSPQASNLTSITVTAGDQTDREGFCYV